MRTDTIASFMNLSTVLINQQGTDGISYVGTGFIFAVTAAAPRTGHGSTAGTSVQIPMLVRNRDLVEDTTAKVKLAGIRDTPRSC